MAKIQYNKSLGRLCTARYPSNLACVRSAEENSKWCSTHEEIEGKLLKLYKRHTVALESDIALNKSTFSTRSDLLKNGLTDGDKDGVISLEELRTWYADFRNQWVLATRALETRIRHHNAFYNGGDAGHLQYLDFLRLLTTNLEDMMRRCDELGYELLLEKERAIWVQRAPPSTESGGCGLETDTASATCGEILCAKNPSDRNGATPARGDRALLTPPPSPTLPISKGRKAKQAKEPIELGPGCQSLSCPDEISCKDLQRRQAIVRKLCAFLQVALLEPRARTWESQNSEAGPICMRDQPIIREPFAKFVVEFISSDAPTTGELEKLTKKLPFVRGESISAELIRDAIADNFRLTGLKNDTDITKLCNDSISLLGGRVFRKPWTGPLPPEAWDVMHQLVACAGCAIGTSRTFSEALYVRRSTFVGGRVEGASRLGVTVPACLPPGAVPRFPRWQDSCSSPEIAMRILNVWLAADNRKAKRSELKKFTPKVRGMKSTYSEHEERHWMYLRMRWSEARLRSFLASLDASDKYTVLAQRQTKPEPTHVYVPKKESHAWVSRVRSGNTPVSRRSARWTTSSVFRMEIFDYFHKRSPEAKAGLAYLDQDDMLEAVVMDDSNGDWDPFLQSVVNVLVSACGYASLDSMLTGELLSIEGH
ncbi:hypothetical protein RhiJN_24723 [Ceratobasidium sp. AG-Ba]|nr:hypothetical protein RhiJN_24723 [Ceratobasidium sp. AG-Ba]